MHQVGNKYIISSWYMVREMSSYDTKCFFLRLGKLFHFAKHAE